MRLSMPPFDVDELKTLLSPRHAPLTVSSMMELEMDVDPPAKL